jgi:hypothetical protein
MNGDLPKRNFRRFEYTQQAIALGRDGKYERSFKINGNITIPRLLHLNLSD